MTKDNIITRPELSGQDTKPYFSEVRHKFFKSIDEKTTISIYLILIVIILLSISFVSPWWTAHYKLKEKSRFIDIHRSNDFVVDFHLTEIVIEETDEKGKFSHSPYEKAETDFVSVFQMIFFMVLALIILTLLLLIFLVRLRLIYKNFYLILVLFIPILVLSISILSLLAINDFWGEITINAKRESYTVVYQPDIGFYFFLISFSLILFAFITQLRIGLRTFKGEVIREHPRKKLNINKSNFVGIILLILALITLISAFNSPWWSCNYSGDGLYKISSANFGWGPDTGYIIAEQDDVNEFSPFDGYTYSEESVYSDEFFSGDFTEDENLTYEREKEVVKNTAFLLYIPMVLLILSIISGFYFLSRRKVKRWLIIILYIAATMLIFSLIFFSITLPIAIQKDMREPYINNEFPIKSNSQAEMITGFSGEWEEDIPHAPWIGEYNAQPEKFEDYSEAYFDMQHTNVHFNWGPTTGYFRCIFTVILTLFGTVFLSISIKNKKNSIESKNALLDITTIAQLSQQESSKERQENMLRIKTMFLVIIILIVLFSPMIIDYSLAIPNTNKNTIDTTEIPSGPYRRYSPITSPQGSGYANKWFIGRFFSLNLDTGEKTMFPGYEKKEDYANHFNDELVVWHSSYFADSDSNSLLIYNLSSKSLDEIEMNNDIEIKGISKNWLLIEMSVNQNYSYFLYYFKKNEMIETPMDVDIYSIVSCPNENYIIFKQYNDDSIYLYNIIRNESTMISQPEVEYGFRSTLVYKKNLILIWRKGYSKNIETTLMFFNTENNEIDYNISGHDWTYLTPYKEGFITSEDNKILYYTFEKMDYTELSVPFYNYFIFYNLFGGPGHYYNDKIYFVISEFKYEDLIYHFNTHLAGRLLVFSSGYTILWELDLNSDTDNDGTLDIYDDDDDNDGVGDYVDAYPYNSTKSIVINEEPKYNYTTPGELIFLTILAIFIGIVIYWRLRKIK